MRDADAAPLFLAVVASVSIWLLLPNEPAVAQVPRIQGQGTAASGMSNAFSAQADALSDVRSLSDYTEWMKGLLAMLPDGRYEVRSFAVDDDRNSVAVYGVFDGTHTGDGGPVPPTGKRVSADYVYVMEFEGDRIRHMTKIWNDGYSLKQLGWM